MSVQYSSTHRTNSMVQLNTDIGASAVIKVFTGSVPSADGVADTGTLIVTYAGNAGGFGTVTQSLAGVTITGTAGQFSCTAPTNPLVVGQAVIITGTFGGTGSITGYASPTTYWIVATNGTTTFTLSTAAGGTGVVTTAGTPTGLTYTQQTGMLTASAVANANASAAGTAGYFRIYPTASSTVNAITQGSIFQTTTLVTNATTIAGSNVLNFASGATVFVAGMLLSGANVPVGATVISSTATTVTMSSAVTGTTIASGVTITGGGDMSMNNTVIALNQVCIFTSLTITATGA